MAGIVIEGSARIIKILDPHNWQANVAPVLWFESSAVYELAKLAYGSLRPHHFSRLPFEESF